MQPIINFGLMYVEGFGPIKDGIFDWGLPGLNVVQAPNGYGKTKFINALVWCIYGKSLSEGSVETWEWLRSPDYKGTKVKLFFTIGQTEYSITRHKNYPKFKNDLIFLVGENDLEKENKYSVQAKIEETLGYSYELFKNSVIFGQKLKRLISETGPNKKKVLDDAFELTYLQKAKKISEEKVKELKAEFNKQNIINIRAEAQVFQKASEIAAEEHMIDNFADLKLTELKQLRLNILELKENHNELVTSLGDIDGTIKEYQHELEIFEKDLFDQSEINKLHIDFEKTSGLLERIKSDVAFILGDIDKYDKQIKNVPTKCFNCGHAYSESEIEEEKVRIIEKRKTSRSELRKFNKSIRLHEKVLLELKESISSAEELLESYNFTTNKLDSLESSKNKISESLKEIKKLKQEVVKIKSRKLVNNLEKLNLELMEFKTQQRKENRILKGITRELESYEWVIKAPLSNSGLRAFIFNQMLDDINERLIYYSKYTGFQVVFFIDMKSANKNLETYVFIRESPVPYEDLSGGQQQTVDIATAFAINDIVSDTKSCNLLILDEVFESLDKNNIELMSEIIQDKSENKSVFVVTHRVEFNPTNANIIGIDYVNGFSSLN